MSNPNQTEISGASAAVEQQCVAVDSKFPRWLCGALFVLLAILVGYSVYLSQTRIYQVDECQNVYMAKVQAAGQSAEFFTSSSLFLFGPLSWITRMHLSSAGMFDLARLLFVGVFWLNLVLIASVATGRLFSTRGLVALVVAATMAPLWDYGFEIRHDNLVLTAVLVIWWLIRVKPLGLLTYFFAGTISVVLLFVAIKAVVYVIPLSAAIWLLPPPGCKTPRWKSAIVGLLGALVAVAAVRLAYGSTNGWHDYLSVFQSVSKYSATGKGNIERFWPWQTLARLLTQTPLLLALTFAALIATALTISKRGRAAFSWDGLLPEALLVLGALGVLMLNPTPFPYNLVHVVPYAVPLAFKYALSLNMQFRKSAEVVILTVVTVALLQFVPFTIASARHLRFTNSRQKELMQLAEKLTDPHADRVYDASGLVLTRSSIHYWWYLHSLNMWLLKLPGEGIRDIFSSQPPSIFIPSYRTDWLADADLEFIRSRYVPLADDFWVLGSKVSPDTGSFEIFHPGRYCIVPTNRLTHLNSPAVPELITGTLDGVSLSDKPVQLTVGKHTIQTSNHSSVAVVWLGPSVDRVPSIAERDHRLLFVNWY